MLFRKIVANLPFSPALVGQLGFYASRLRREEITRRTGLLFVVLALIVQSLAIFSPPESANAANGNNVIYGGVGSKDELLKIYDRNKDSAGHKDIKEIYKEFGITRDDIKNAQTTTFNSKDHDGKILSVGRSNAHSYQDTPINVDDSSTTVYQGYIHSFDTYAWSKQHGTTYKAVIGKRAIDGKWFGIMFACGNPIYLQHPKAPQPTPPKPTAACSELTLQSIDRTNYRFKGSANAKNGAKITSYTYVVKDSTGSIVATKTDTTSSDTSKISYTFVKDGTYKIILSVATSVGVKNDVDCVKSLTISPQPVCSYNPSLPASSSDCKPCENKSDVWYKDSACTSSFELTKRVKNVTQLTDNANNKLANPGDQLEYHLTVKNVGAKTGSYTIKDNLSDVLEYADIVDKGDGSLATNDISTPVEGQHTITWPVVELAPNQSVEKIVLVQVKQTISAMPQNAGNPESYNCQMVNNFEGQQTTVLLTCPPAKVVEQVVDQLPQTGAGTNILFGTIVLAISAFFYARSRQLKKEVRLIRRDLNAGTI